MVLYKLSNSNPIIFKNSSRIAVIGRTTVIVTGGGNPATWGWASALSYELCIFIYKGKARIQPSNLIDTDPLLKIHWIKKSNLIPVLMMLARAWEHKTMKKITKFELQWTLERFPKYNIGKTFLKILNVTFVQIKFKILELFQMLNTGTFFKGKFW